MGDSEKVKLTIDWGTFPTLNPGSPPKLDLGSNPNLNLGSAPNIDWGSPPPNYRPPSISEGETPPSLEKGDTPPSIDWGTPPSFSGGSPFSATLEIPTPTLTANVGGTDKPVLVGPVTATASVGGTDKPIQLAPIKLELGLAPLKTRASISLEVRLFGIRILSFALGGNVEVCE